MAWQVEWLILWEMFIKMLTRIHVVVYTWWYWHICKGEVGVEVDQLGEEIEAKGETPPAKCPPIECGQSDGATSALYRKDRVSQSGPDTGVLRPVSGGRERAGVGLRLDAGAESDRTLAGCVRSG